MENDKATAWLTLADADAVEQKVVDIVNRLFGADNQFARNNSDELARRLSHSFHLQNAVANHVLPQVRTLIAEEVRMNFKIEHYYESWNRTAGYRVRYGSNVIQTEQIKLGF